MATIVQSAKKTTVGASSDTVAFSSNVTAGSLLVVAVGIYDPSAGGGNVITTPTDTKGNTYTAVDGDIIFNSGIANTQHLTFFVAVANASGANTVTFGQTHSSGVYAVCFIAELSGVETSFPITGRWYNTSNSATTSASTEAVTIGPTVTLLSLCIHGGAGNPVTYTAGGGFTNLQTELDANTYQTGALAYKTISAIGSHTPSFTITNARYGMMTIAVLDAESNASGWSAPTFSDSGVTTGANSALGYPAIRPNALYDADAGVDGITVVPFLGSSSNLCVVTYNHNNAAWDSPQLSIDTGGVDDGHGSPSIIKDSSGYYHIFWGGHVTALQYCKSTNPNDPSAWTGQTSPLASCSYPTSLLLSTNDIGVFYRTAGHQSAWAWIKSTDNGATWGSATNILGVSSGDSWYCSLKMVGDVGHFNVTWQDDNNVNSSPYPEYIRRYGIYAFKYDFVNNVLTYADGTTGSSADFPITKSNLTTHGTIRAAAVPVFDHEQRVTIGLDGNPAILLVRGTNIHHVCSFVRYNYSGSSTFTTMCATGIDHTNDVGMVVNTSTNNWTAFVIRKGSTGLAGNYDSADNAVDIGGSLDQYDSTDDGATWVRSGTISSRTNLDYPCDVESGRSPVKYLVADYTDLLSYTGHIFGFDAGTTGGATIALRRQRARQRQNTLLRM